MERDAFDFRFFARRRRAGAGVVACVALVAAFAADREPVRVGAGRSTLSPPTPGMDMTVTVAGTARAGDRVPISVRVTDTDGFWNGTLVGYGDGSQSPMYGAARDCAWPEGPPTAWPPEPTDRTQTFFHIWARPGTYLLEVSADTTSGPCHIGPNERRTVRTKVVVTGDGVSGNGPVRPRMTAILGQDGQLYVEAHDPDGVVRDYAIDWGDGSAPFTRTLRTRPCEASPVTGYPVGRADGTHGHRWPRPGTYTLTLHVTSVACGGGGAQGVTTETTVTVR